MPEQPKHAILVDIDGTLSDTRRRVRHVTNGNRDWESFYSEMNQDTHIEPVCALVRSLHAQGWTIVLGTGRPEKYRRTTEEWMGERGVPYHILLMRKDGDHRPAPVAKMEMLHALRQQGLSVIMAIDDDPRVAQVFRERGRIVVLQTESNIGDGDAIKSGARVMARSETATPTHAVPAVSLSSDALSVWNRP